MRAEGRNLDEYVMGLGPRLERLVRALEDSGYLFANPTAVLPGPAGDVEATIAKVEALVGALPAALLLFYRQVGSVDLRGWRGDALHKANVSGGMWYGVEVPNANQDPLVLEEPHGLPFTEYLELALSWGGFPGLARAPHHSWPVERLRDAAKAD